MSYRYGIPPRQLGRMLTSRDFAELLAFERLEPRGESRADWRAGMIASTVANVHARRGRRYQPKYFMPRFDSGPKRAQTPEEMQAVMRSIREAQQRRKARSGG